MNRDIRSDRVRAGSARFARPLYFSALRRKLVRLVTSRRGLPRVRRLPRRRGGRWDLPSPMSGGKMRIPRFQGLRGRLSYANVMATLAFFFALTGGAMATGKY